MSKKVDKLSNFLPINRRFFKHALWKENRTFSKAEAWLWLIAEARFDAAGANELVGGKMIRWVRGEIPASLRYLAEVWNWEKNQVDRFLKLLEKEAMIIRRLDQGQTIIKLINYSTHNGLGQQMGQLNPIPVGDSDEQQDSKWDSDGTVTGQGRDNTNIVNIENKEREERHASGDHEPTDEEMKLFEGFKQWITQNAPRINQMKEPFTIKQYLKLRKSIDRTTVGTLLIDMHNWEPLIKKNRSAYLTIIKWHKLHKERVASQPGLEETDKKKMVL